MTQEKQVMSHRWRSQQDSYLFWMYSVLSIGQNWNPGKKVYQCIPSLTRVTVQIFAQKKKNKKKKEEQEEERIKKKEEERSRKKKKEERRFKNNGSVCWLYLANINIWILTCITRAHPGLSIVLIVAVHKVDDLVRYVVQVEYGWVGVQAGSMKLITVFHGQLTKCWEISLSNNPDHLLHTKGHHNIGPVLWKSIVGELQTYAN